MKPEAPMLGRSLREVWPEAMPLFEQRVRRVLATGESFGLTDEYVPIIRGGQLTDAWFTWTARRLVLPEHGDGVLLLVHETTARVVAEKDLRATEERFRLATEALNGLVYEWDASRADEGAVRRSGNLFDLVGFRPEEVSPNAGWWHDRIHPGDRPALDAALAANLARRDPLYDHRYRVRHAAGHYVHVRDKGRVVYDEAGQPRRVVGCTEDITAEVARQAALAESEERFRTLADNIDQLAWMGDPEGNLTWYNRQWLEYTGTTLEEMRGWGWRTVHDPAHLPRVMETWGAALRAGVEWEDTFPLRARDGSFRWFLSRAQPIRDESGRIVRWFGTNTDITDLREAGQALQRSMAEAEEARARAESASGAKDRFLAALSHELRTPLTPVLLAVDTLRRRTDLPPDVIDWMEMISRNVRLEARFIDDLLDLTRVVHGKLVLKPGDLDPCALVREAAAIVRPEIDARHHSLRLEVPDRSRTLHGDSARLQQVVWNLLRNAAKFTPEGGDIVLRVECAGDPVIIEVTDSGVGFKPELADRIFQPFEQTSDTVTRRFGGLGLGLAISRATVEAHGGRLTGRSDGPGRGATFRVELPLTS